MLGHEKGKRIPVLRRAEKNNFMKHLQEESCDSRIRQLLGFPKDQKRRRRFEHEKLGNSLINLGGTVSFVEKCTRRNRIRKRTH